MGKEYQKILNDIRGYEKQGIPQYLQGELTSYDAIVNDPRAKEDIEQFGVTKTEIYTVEGNIYKVYYDLKPIPEFPCGSSPARRRTKSRRRTVPVRNR